MDPGFCSGISRPALVIRRPRGTFSRPGTQADNLSAPLPHHVWRSKSSAKKGPSKIQPDDVVPVFERSLPNLRVSTSPEIVDEYVQATVSLDRGVNQGPSVLLFGNVTDRSASTTAHRLDCTNDCLKRFFIEVGQSKLGTLLRQPESYRSPQAVRRPSHYRYFALNTPHFI